MARPKSKFLELLAVSPGPILADGAMGSMLHTRGVDYRRFDVVNLTDPEVVIAIHKAYIEAGAQVVTTNTFGANRYKLAEHGLGDKLVAINQAGVDLVRRAALEASRDVLVAGNVGPLGVRLAPFGRVQPGQARKAFTEQIGVLANAGVDLIIIETMSELSEISEAVAAAREACDLPVVASMTFTRDDRTVLGDGPETVVRRLQNAGPDLIGVNCSGGPTQILRILTQMRHVVPEARFSVMPNAGFPEQVAGRIMYPASPDYFGEYARAFSQAGVSLIGGCCGTTPEHIAAMRVAIDQPADPAKPGQADMPPVVVPPADQDLPGQVADQPTALARNLAEGVFSVAVEMQPPRGLSTHKLLAGASLLAEAGADVINVADSPMARMRMSPWAVCNLIQQKIKIETTLHFPTRGRNLLRVQGDLLAAHAMDVRNVFVVMGDPTAIGDYPDAMDDYDLVPSGLIQLIKQGFNAGVDHAGLDIGQPTSFFVGAALNLTPSDPDREIEVLRRKIQVGADFFLTQPVYQAPAAVAFLERYAATYGPLQVPVLAGVLPLYSARHAAFLHNEVPGIAIPEMAIQRLQSAGEDAPRVGVDITLALIGQLAPLVSGIYIIPAFSRYDLVADIIERVK